MRDAEASLWIVMKFVTDCPDPWEEQVLKKKAKGPHCGDCGKALIGLPRLRPIEYMRCDECPALLCLHLVYIIYIFILYIHTPYIRFQAHSESILYSIRTYGIYRWCFFWNIPLTNPLRFFKIDWIRKRLIQEIYHYHSLSRFFSRQWSGWHKHQHLREAKAAREASEPCLWWLSLRPLRALTHRACLLNWGECQRGFSCSHGESWSWFWNKLWLWGLNSKIIKALSCSVFWSLQRLRYQSLQMFSVELEFRIYQAYGQLAQEHCRSKNAWSRCWLRSSPRRRTLTFERFLMSRGLLLM